MKVLIAEDEQLVRNLFERLLEMKGHKALAATTGMEAIEAVRTHDIDIVFMDIMMPDLDGVEALKEIRKFKPTALVVMMSGFALEEKVEEAKALGAFDFMYKPFKMTDLSAILEKAEAQLRKPA